MMDRMRGWVWVSGGAATALAFVVACGSTRRSDAPHPSADAGSGGSDAVGGSGEHSGSGASGQLEGGAAGANEPPEQGGAGGTPTEVDKVQITGLVVAHNERPVAGVKLRVDGQELMTAADGSFAVQAAVPYDIVLEQPAMDPGQEAWA